MTKLHLLFVFLLAHFASAQMPVNVYFLHGQGSDTRLFDSIQLKTGYVKNCIAYGTPKRGSTMESFARELALQIDTTQPFVLVGTSLGGMLCTEMSEFLHPQQTILISSAANRKELPFRYRFQRVIPLYFIVPGFLMAGGARMLQPIVEPDRKHNKATFKSMLKEKNGKYMRRTVRMIICWKRKSNTAALYKIHGTKDHTLPLRKIKNVNVVIEDGSHMMTLTRANEISTELNKALWQITCPVR